MRVTCLAAYTGCFARCSILQPVISDRLLRVTAKPYVSPEIELISPLMKTPEITPKRQLNRPGGFKPSTVKSNFA
jgi:hypothetical protein